MLCHGEEKMVELRTWDCAGREGKNNGCNKMICGCER